MKKVRLWKWILAGGIGLFVLPLLLGIYHTWIESWALFDWILLYSVVYWPTYLAGAILIALALYLRTKARQA